MNNTNHRGDGVGSPLTPKTQQAQAQEHPRFTAPNAGIAPSFGEAKSPIVQGPSFTKMMQDYGNKHVDRMDRMERQMDRANAASTPTVP